MKDVKIEAHFILHVKGPCSREVAKLLAVTFGELIVQLGGKDVKVRVEDPARKKNLLEHLGEGG